VARRTKAEALQTRHKLLDAAEAVFLRQGVSRTSLADIATEAGATRGAIYWHFKDKTDLFDAMMERVTLPLEEVLQAASSSAAQSNGEDSLQRMCQLMRAALHKTVHDPQTRRVFEIATHKVEYTPELQALAQRRLAVFQGMVAVTERALGLHMLVDGLINLWLLDPQGFDLEATGAQAIDNYLRGLGLEGQCGGYTASSSTSNSSVALGGITPPAPRAP
jgi:TetR/AcrR family transcriptional regulator, acrAB operon repressor